MWIKIVNNQMFVWLALVVVAIVFGSLLKFRSDKDRVALWMRLASALLVLVILIWLIIANNSETELDRTSNLVFLSLALIGFEMNVILLAKKFINRKNIAVVVIILILFFLFLLFISYKSFF
jgi:hypothetical protein